MKQLWDEGAKAYVQDLWNILDFITNSLYIATFTLKFVAYMRVSLLASFRNFDVSKSNYHRNMFVCPLST